MTAKGTDNFYDILPINGAKSMNQRGSKMKIADPSKEDAHVSGFFDRAGTTSTINMTEAPRYLFYMGAHLPVPMPTDKSFAFPTNPSVSFRRLSYLVSRSITILTCALLFFLNWSMINNSRPFHIIVK